MTSRYDILRYLVQSSNGFQSMRYPSLRINPSIRSFREKESTASLAFFRGVGAGRRTHGQTAAEAGGSPGLRGQAGGHSTAERKASKRPREVSLVLFCFMSFISFFVISLLVLETFRPVTCWLAVPSCAKPYGQLLTSTERERERRKKKLDDEWPESIFHHVGSQSASYLLSVL